MDESLTVGQLHGVSFKKRAPKAIKEIKAFALQAMVRSTTDTDRRFPNRETEPHG